MKTSNLSIWTIALAVLASCHEPGRNNRDKPATGRADAAIDTTVRSQVYTADVGFNGDEKNFLVTVSGNNSYLLECSTLAMQVSGDPKIANLAAVVSNETRKADADLRQIADGKGLLLDRALSKTHLEQLTALRTLKAQDFDRQYLTILSAHYADLTRQLNRVKKFKEKNLIAFTGNLLPQATLRFAQIAKLAENKQR